MLQQKDFAKRLCRLYSGKASSGRPEAEGTREELRELLLLRKALSAYRIAIIEGARYHIQDLHAKESSSFSLLAKGTKAKTIQKNMIPERHG